MGSIAPDRPAPRSGLVLAVAAVLQAAALLACGRGTTQPTTPSDDRSAPTVVLDQPAAWADGVVDEQDGVLPDGVTVFDDQHPGIAHLDPDLLRAVRAAAADAAGGGVTFFVHSAWRSPEYQEQLFRDAVAEHGSEEEARRWAATPERSRHVTGDAIDVGGGDAQAWLAEHGAAHGLCRTYANEPWHVELVPTASADGCPAPYADATEDPRLQP